MKRLLTMTLLVISLTTSLLSQHHPKRKIPDPQPQIFWEKPDCCGCKDRFNYVLLTDSSSITDGYFSFVDSTFYISVFNAGGADIRMDEFRALLYQGSVFRFHSIASPAVSYGSCLIKPMGWHQYGHTAIFEVHWIEQFDMSSPDDYCVTIDNGGALLPAEDYISLFGTIPGFPVQGDIEISDSYSLDRTIFSDYNFGQKRIYAKWTTYGTLRLGCFDTSDNDEGVIEMSEEAIEIRPGTSSQYGGKLWLHKDPYGGATSMLGSDGPNWHTNLQFTDSTGIYSSDHPLGKTIELFNPPSKIAVGNNKLVWKDYVAPLTGTGPPPMTPDYVGQRYHDQAAIPVIKIYEAVNTTGSSDWIPLN